jgi:hypothetical protein
VVAGRVGDAFGDLRSLDLACISFTNEDARVAKSVRVQFVYFNTAGDRSDGTLLTRNGTFSRGIPDLAANSSTHRVNRDNCISLHPPHGTVSAVVGYVDRVDFSDSSSWSASGVHIANHVSPGSSAEDYAFLDPMTAMNPVSDGGTAVSSGELAPLILGTFAGCTQASAAPGNVFVNAEPGTAASGNLFNIGDASVCAPSGNPADDEVAVQLVKQSHVAIHEAQVFRVYFPALNTSAACTDDARLLNRVIVDAPPTIQMAQPPKPGEYDAIVDVSVGSDGHASQVSTSQSAGPPEFDDAARRSALQSRYWPAMSAGKPVTGRYEFPMRWVIQSTRGVTTTRVFGPATRPAAAGCAV